MTQIMAYDCCCLNYSKMNIVRSFVKCFNSIAAVHMTFNLLKKIPLRIGSKTGKIFEPPPRKA